MSQISMQRRLLSTPSESQTTPETSRPSQKERSRHATWYTDTFPHMVPIALLGFIVYGALEITRTYLARERQSVEHLKRIAQLEEEILSYQERLKIASPTTQGSSNNVAESPNTQKSRWWPF